MQEYEEYKKQLQEHILEYLPREFQGAAVSFQTVTKEWGEEEGIIIQTPWHNSAPIIYLQDWYQRYRETGDLEETIQGIADMRVFLFERENGLQRIIEEQKLTDYEQIKDQIFPMVIHSEIQKEYLENNHLVYRDLMDLAVIYKVKVAEFGGDRGWMPVTERLLETYQVTEEELYAQSMENMHRESKIHTMVIANGNEKEMFFDPMFADVQPEEWKDYLDKSLMMVRDMSLPGGAGVLCNQEVLQKLAEAAGEDLIIIPSSVEEILVLRADDGFSSLSLDTMIQSVNSTDVLPGQVLSDHAYYYSRQEQELMTFSEYEERRMEQNPLQEYLRRSSARRFSPLDLER